ncbi:MAG: energy-coupling factor ABC transporter permease [Rhodocyclaceae bacterium]|uniref:energy-coupling factor ABC transporter permease n=1 Tax=Sulfuricystis thermophila TaxID=2496847 RepID=UPI0010364226|nr:energy-coupling factor ABC transporter permease [Sulfuricystis thermophila]MDI6749114.1 energy-coupling factor ABC transporter permease [Rhodocyclaceae bacterium]
MHIPDGFLSPQTYLPATLLAVGTWVWAARGLKSRLDETLLPRLAMVTALAYALGLVMLPLPGGTSAHLIGVAMLALLFGWRLAFLAYSGVLLLQALLFGAGGLTALPVNALAMGFIGSGTALIIFRLVKRSNESVAVLLSAWASVILPGIVIALVLGLQPLIAHKPDGSPLFFPFGWSITLPAILIPHALIGLAEAALTLFVWRYAKARKWTS